MRFINNSMDQIINKKTSGWKHCCGKQLFRNTEKLRQSLYLKHELSRLTTQNISVNLCKTSLSIYYCLNSFSPPFYLSVKKYFLLSLSYFYFCFVFVFLSSNTFSGSSLCCLSIEKVLHFVAALGKQSSRFQETLIKLYLIRLWLRSQGLTGDHSRFFARRQ